MPLQRIEALAGIIISLALAILPVVGNFDWTSTAGVLAGIVAVLGIVAKRLDGWQKDEAHQQVRHLAALDLTGELPGASEGVKAEGFTPREKAKK
jgi:hypothetical protein